MNIPKSIKSQRPALILLTFSPAILLLLPFWRYGITLKLIWDTLLAQDLGNILAALIAVGGYALDNYNARMHRQHEALMDRVTNQSHQFLIPITEQFHALWLGNLCFFVDSQIDEYYGPKEKQDQLAAAVGDFYVKLPFLARPTSMHNPASLALLAADMMGFEEGSMASAPVDLSSLMKREAATMLPRELPLFLHSALQTCERPSSKLWREYEIFIRHEFVPSVNRIAEIIHEHGDLMESVPAAKLEKMFGKEGTGYGQPWPCAPRMWFYAQWVAYARSWQSVLAQWDASHYDYIRPRCHFPIGLLRFNVEAQKIVDEVEKKLVGVSQMSGHSTTSK